MHSNYDSVQEQTGIFAGKGGFDITTGEHTQLNGAVIGSTAAPDKNRLDTGSLGFGDIENKARYQVEHLSESFGTGGNTGLQFLGNAAGILMVGVNGNGHDSSTTKAAVSDGSIIIRDASARRQDVAGLSRDVEHANQTLSPIFNKEKEQQRLQEAQKISEIALQAADIAATQGKIKATRAANDKIAGASQHDRDKALAGLKKQDPSKQYSEADIENQVYQNFYHQALTESGFGTGGKVQQAIQAATAAVQGLAGGNIGAAIAGGAAPYLAEVIHKMTEDKTVPGGINVEANLMAHAVVGAVVAQASGHSALAGAAGATTGEFIAQQLYPGTDRNQLTEEQKQTVSTLGTLAAGLAGGLTGGSAADTVAGAQSGKNAVENNFLSQKQQAQKDKEIAACQSVSCKAGAQAKWTAIDLGQDGSFAAGMVAGVPAALYDTVDGIVKTASSPVETYQALKALFSSGDVLGNVSDAVKQSYIDRIDRMETQYQQAGASGSFNAGVEGGKLVTDIAGLLAGGAGIVKGGVVLTEKVVAKVAGKAESAAVNTGKATSGAENVVTYPKLKDDLVQQNLNNIAKQDPRLAEAVKGSGTKNPNFSVGMGTASEAENLGKIWVGDGARLLTDGKGWVSADGTRVYRFPASKPNTPQDLNPTGVQANFETLKDGKRVSNGHMGISQ